MITPSFGLTVAERVLPKLALDFTTAVLDPRVTFTRTTGAANPATYVDSSGYIAAATNNQPRFDYNPTSLICNGLLIEEARTNLITYSEAIGGTNWTVQSGATASLNDATSPANTTTATLLTGASAVATFQSITLTANTSYTISVFAKAGTSTRSALGLLDNTGGDFQGRLFITWSSGVPSTQSTAGTVTNVVYTPYGNGWYRIIFTTNSDATNTAHRYYFYPDTLATGGTVYVWGAQLEAGAFATSYIPTTTTALTRNADVATMTGTNFSDWFNASEGTVVAWGTQQSEDQSGGQRRGFTCISDATNNNRISLSPVQFNVVTGGSPVVNQTFAGFVANQNYKIAGAYKLNNSQSASNATLSSNDTSCAVPTVTQLQFGTFRIADGLMCGHLQKFMFYPQRLTSAEIQAVSK